MQYPSLSQTGAANRLGKGEIVSKQNQATRVRQICKYAESSLRTETINLKLLPTDAAALWDARNKRSVVVCIDDAENTGAHLSTMHTGPVTASHPQDPGLKSVIQPPQAESDPTVQMVADWQLKLERWRIIHHGAASKAINQMPLVPTPSPREAAEASIGGTPGGQVSFSSLLSDFLTRVLRMDSPRSSMR
jgi:hypothetical protein